MGGMPVEIVAAGDVLLSRNIRADESLAPVREALTQADIGCATLEMSLPAFPPTPAVVPRGGHVAGRVSALADLSWLGVDIVNFANNHVMDFGERGASDTIAELRRARMPFAGAGPTLGEARAPGVVEHARGGPGPVRGF